MAEAGADIDADARDRSFPDDLKGLAQEAKAFASAELAFQKARAAYVGGAIKSVTILFIVAVVLAFFALEALVFGAVLALAPLITAWGATAVVCGVLALAALFCVFRGLRSWRLITKAIAGD